MRPIDKISILLIGVASVLAIIAWPLALGVSVSEGLEKVTASNFVSTAFSTLVAAFAGA